MNLNGLTPQFTEIFKKLEKKAVLGGLDFSLTRVKQNDTWTKIYNLTCFAFVMSLELLNLHGIYTNRNNPPAILYEMGSSGCGFTSLCIYYDFSFYRLEYKEILLYVAKFHAKHRHQFGYLYEKAFVICRKLIKATVIIMICTHLMIVSLHSFVQILTVPIWTEEGHFNIVLPHLNHLPWIPVKGWISFVINFIHQNIASALVLNAYTLFVLTIFILLIIFDVQLEIITEFVTRISDTIKLSKDNSCKIDLAIQIRKGLKDVFQMHIEFTNYVNKLVKSTSTTFFTFKVNAFVFTFFIFINLREGNADQIKAFGAIGALSWNFFITYCCDRFDDANKHLLEKVNDMPWYDLSPQDRRLLLPFILKLQSPSLLQTKGFGGSETISFEQLAETFQAVYSWCLVIQKVIAKIH